MGRKFNIWLFVAVVVVLPLSVYAVVNWYERSVQALPVLISKTHTIADYRLINQLGNESSTQKLGRQNCSGQFLLYSLPLCLSKNDEQHQKSAAGKCWK
jgi:protein SCO1/2